ncbi:methanol/ethanol family PQQ-dependent dehydrogenase [Hyphomicrobium denitrificans 1NES1]|uniref:Methanol/ethanol family PQQ-dependent dehydrogenase n=1 Tax=Hyphomicrobium denitrificans 1NES1 TaxID=670307 RepID=N0B8K6_9HYPH|nr:methanol/ethanol family PQQ-dependent dehydrogenase [Hyphomicrobium denitrificans]AGK56881.1 methanol/ethanol family PQQ-dependent dehydrogenase [Hyphomicrobium denitrificans 1NES1]
MRKLMFAASIAAVTLVSPALANEDVTKNQADPNNWASQSGDYSATRYSTLDQINTSNVADLKVAWTFSTGVLRGHEGSPLVIGDVMYLHTPFPNIVFALNLADEQKIIWKYEPKQDPSVIPVMCCDTVNRGLAYADGKIILQQADTNVVALDAKTGKELWKVANGDPKRGETATNTVLIVKDKVITAISGAEFGVRGYVTAYDLNSGKKVWRAYNIGPDKEILFNPEKTTSLGKPVGKDSSLKTWNGDQWKIGGGTLWGGWSYDPEADLFYYGSANPSTWNPAQRAGLDGKPIDQKWTMSIIARNPDTGVARWAYQMTPFDEWDYDGVNENILVDLDIKGQKTPALVHFDRNGFAYTLNRKDGELLVAEKFDPAVNWATGIDMDKSSKDYGRPIRVAKYSTFRDGKGQDVNTKGICPAALGSKDMQPASFSKLTGLFYVPTNHVCMDYEPFKVSYTSGQPYVGATLSMYPAPDSHGGMGNFIAWDGAQGKIVWSKPEQFSVWSGALTTAGGVVFYGTLEGYFKAVDQKDGKELFKFKTPSGIISNAMTYTHGGKQYIGVMSGVGGWAGIGLAAGLTNPTDGLGAVGGYAGLKQYTNLGGTLTVFSLP